MCCAATFVLLLASYTSLDDSGAASAFGGILPALFIAPAFVPRWRSSQQEAVSVAVAVLATVIFWNVLPIVTVVHVSNLTITTEPCSYLLDSL